MKDEKYYELLKEVTNRLLSQPWEMQTENELENAKKILLSSGHDLDDLNDFKQELNKNIADYFSGFGT